MIPALSRNEIFPESELPDGHLLVAEGRELAASVSVGPCAFLSHYGVASESEYKRRRMSQGQAMLHAQIGYRDLAKSKRAAVEIFQRLEGEGLRLDRYGICLDWSMGYPVRQRAGMPRGTGLILESAEQFSELTAAAPVAPHFGDFVIGTPAALENTAAALKAGATVIGNLGQYFTFRLPRFSDDVLTTAESVKAITLMAAQPVPVLVHSNLDDGFAATMNDLSSVAGMVMVEKYIVEDLLGATLAHCYGHTFSDPLTRLAFQRVLAEASGPPGSMVYGNTTSYGPDRLANYAHLAAYLLVDAAAQATRPSGHALNPVPVSEAERIPEVEEIVDAHRFARRLLTRIEDGIGALISSDEADTLAKKLIAAGTGLKQRLLTGLDAAGIDVDNPFEMLLALRRLGARRIEALFAENADPEPIAPSPHLASLELLSRRCFEALDREQIEVLKRSGLKACVASSDVHEYGKRLVETLLNRLGVSVVDGGVSVDAEALARCAVAAGADFIALSTYNGVALDYVRDLISCLSALNENLPVFIGGKLNQIPEDSNSAMPVDVTAEIIAAGAVVCRTPEDMIARLARMQTRAG